MKWPWQKAAKATTDPAVTSAIADLQTQVAALTKTQGAYVTTDQFKTALQAKDDAIAAIVARFTNLEQSTGALLNGLTAALAAARDQITSLQQTVAQGTDLATLQPQLDALDQNMSALSSVADKFAADVTANTPAS